MSLINQMLRDLDARHSDVAGPQSYGPQLRTVPERSRFHRAWWIPVALGAVLAAVLGWELVRSPLARRSDARHPVAQEKKIVPARTDAAPASPISGKADAASATAKAAPASPSPAPAKKKTASKAELAAKPPATAPTPLAKSPPKPVVRDLPKAAQKPQALTPYAKLGDAPALPNLSKQIKELTTEQRADNEYRKAVSLMQQGMTTAAIQGLEEALRIDARHAAARQTLIGLLLENKRQDEALRVARVGLSLDASQAGLAMIAARLQVEKGELKPAIETLEKALPHAAERADYQSFLAALLQRDGRQKEAIEHYLLALRDAPQNGVWWMGLGISFQADSRPAEAREAFSRAKESNSLSPELLAFVEAKLRQLRR